MWAMITASLYWNSWADIFVITEYKKVDIITYNPDGAGVCGGGGGYSGDE